MVHCTSAVGENHFIHFLNPFRTWLKYLGRASKTASYMSRVTHWQTITFVGSFIVVLSSFDRCLKYLHSAVKASFYFSRATFGGKTLIVQNIRFPFKFSDFERKRFGLLPESFRPDFSGQNNI